MTSRVLLGFSLISAICIAVLWSPVYHRATVLGFTRSQASIQNSHKDDQLIYIPNTVHCEDIHYHHASNMLYTACEGDATIRKHWFPPIGHMQRQEKYGGQLVIIDPKVSPPGKVCEHSDLLDLQIHIPPPIRLQRPPDHPRNRPLPLPRRPNHNNLRGQPPPQPLLHTLIQQQHPKGPLPN